MTTFTRSDQQNKALHKDCLMIARKLNANFITVQDVVRSGFHLDWTAKNLAAVVGATKVEEVLPVLEIAAKSLNEAGYSVIPVIQNALKETRWTTMLVKELLWRSVQRVTVRKESTTDLAKLEGEIELIHKLLMRELGEKFGIEWHEFPNDPDKKNQRLKAMAIAKKLSYPTEELTPTF